MDTSAQKAVLTGLSGGISARVSAALAAAGAVIAGSAGAEGRIVAPPVRNRRPVYGNAMTTKAQRNRGGLPHYGAKQAAKDAKRKLYMENFFLSHSFDGDRYVPNPRSAPIIIQFRG